jgi:hypothetical protein
VEWALRSSILILAGALLLWACRLKDARLRLAAWVAMLCGSLALPILTAILPAMPVARGSAVAPASLPAAQVVITEIHSSEPPVPSFDWSRAALLLYATVAGGLLLRLLAGAAMGARLLRRSRATGRSIDGIEIRESERVSAPVTLGIVRSAIVLRPTGANGSPPSWKPSWPTSVRTSTGGTPPCNCSRRCTARSSGSAR